MTRQFTIFERLVLKKFGFVGLVNGRNDRERRRIKSEKRERKIKYDTNVIHVSTFYITPL